MLSIPKLAADFRGHVIAPDDPDYDSSRKVFMGTIDKRPAAIVRVADTDDVARAIALARDTGLELAVRSGGHSPAGHALAEGGIVIDLGDLRALEVDARSRTAWAETGLTAAEYTTAAGVHGLATGFGDAGTVGVGGITLAGGVGFLLRKHGLTIDNLLAAEMVTADGELVRADADSHPDLFWALRGGGGNFGVVTRLLLRLHEVDQFVGGMLFLPATPEVIAGFVAEAEAAPDELSTIANVMTAPPMPFLPAELHGSPVLMALMAYTGDVQVGERALAPFRALATPIVDMVGPITYPEMYQPEDEEYRPKAVSRTLMLDSVDLAAAERIVESVAGAGAMMAVTQLRVLGGAMARVPADATAFAHRGSRIMANVAAMYMADEDRDRLAGWVEDLAAGLHQGDDAAYVGFLDDEGEDRVRAAYPGATWDRLTEVKAQYDPDNVFRLNQNVPPARTP
jgi:FAD/FMN-containing dehydrogenase